MSRTKWIFGNKPGGDINEVDLCLLSLVILPHFRSIFRHSVTSSLTQTQGGDAHPLDRDQQVGHNTDFP